MKKRKKRAPVFDCTASNVAVILKKRMKFPSSLIDLLIVTRTWHRTAPTGRTAPAPLPPPPGRQPPAAHSSNTAFFSFWDFTDLRSQLKCRPLHVICPCSFTVLVRLCLNLGAATGHGDSPSQASWSPRCGPGSAASGRWRGGHTHSVGTPGWSAERMPGRLVRGPKLLQGLHGPQRLAELSPLFL